MTTFEQIKPTIISSLGLQGAKEVWSNYSTEYEDENHPDYPKTLLVWADFKDDKDGKYILYEFKVLDNRDWTPLSDRLVYALGRTQISKEWFDKDCGSSIDSKRFGMFKQSNGLEETPFFRTRMEQLLTNKE
jgi:hypothetical protein